MALKISNVHQSILQNIVEIPMQFAHQMFVVLKLYTVYTSDVCVYFGIAG